MTLTFTIEVPVAAVAPAFTSGPTISGTPANGQTMTLAYTFTGTAPVTEERRWKIGDGILSGETAMTWVGLGLNPGEVVTSEVRLTGPDGATTGWVPSNALTVASAPSDRIATALRSSITYDDPIYGDVVCTFSEPVPVGEFVNSVSGAREYFALSTADCQMINASPAAAIIDGHMANGMMRDPYIISDVAAQTAPQGFDGWISVGTGGLAASVVPYSDTVNVDPAISGPIFIPAGTKTTYTKSVRFPGFAAQGWQAIAKYVHLHILPEAPPVGSYAPSATSLTKRMVNRNDIDYSVLRSLNFATLFPDFPLTVAQALAHTPRYGNRFIVQAERARRFRVDRAINPAVDSNYVGDLCTAYTAMSFLLLRDDLTTQERQALTDRVISHGLDYFAIIERDGNNITQGAGQGGSITPALYYTAFLLQDAELLSIAQNVLTDNNSLPRWIDGTQIGQAVLNGTSSPTRTSQTFFDEHYGVPFNVALEFTSDQGRYTITSTFAIYPELSSIWMLRNGPAGISGARAFLNGATENDTTDDKSASTALQFRVRTWDARLNNGRNIENWQHQIFDAALPLTDLVGWNGPPDQIPHGSASGFVDTLFTTGPGAGQVSYNISAFDYATQAITAVQTRYSLDGRQWVVQDQGVALAGTISGMNPVPHFMGVRRASAAGFAPWSINYPYTATSALRSVRTPPGTASGTPVNTVAPRMLLRKYPLWDTFPVYEDAPALLDANASLELAAGVGYWTGGLISTFGYRWQQSDDNVTWEDIPNATAFNLTRTAALANKDLRCGVTPANAGSPTVYTNSVRMPALAVVPAGTIISTTFDNAFAITYEAELNETVAVNGILKHQPTQSLSSFHQLLWDKIKPAGAGLGVLRVAKTAGSPRAPMKLSRPLLAGKTYRVQATLAQGYGTAAGGANNVSVSTGPGTFGFDLQTQVGEASILAGGQIVFPAILLGDAPLFRQVDVNVTIGASDVAAQVRIINNTSTGGTGGSDPILTELSITEV